MGLRSSPKEKIEIRRLLLVESSFGGEEKRKLTGTPRHPRRVGRSYNIQAPARPPRRWAGGMVHSSSSSWKTPLKGYEPLFGWVRVTDNFP